MAKQPLISIITINRDNFEGLKRTINSVLNQTWKHFEYIVIDGDSKDGSAEYLKDRSSEIDYWVSEPDTGIYNAMNKGIKKASGDYLLFLNSGDHFFDVESLNIASNFLKSYDFIYFDLEVQLKEKSFVKEYPTELSFSYFIEDTLPHPATFIRKSVLEKHGFYDEELKIVSDWKFFILSICHSNSSYKHIDKVLSVFYLDGVSSDGCNANLIQEEKSEVLNKFFPLFLEDVRELKKLKESLGQLKRSKKIQILVRTGMLTKF